MTIFLTGATGFLGSYLLHGFIKSGYDVIITKRSESLTWRIDEYIENIKCYNTDFVSYEEIFHENKIDIIVHTITSYGRDSEKISEILETNLILPIKLVEAAIKCNVKTFINTDTLLAKNLNSYSLSKKQFIEWFKQFENKIKFINLKIEHMYGPKDSEIRFACWLIKLLLNDVPYIKLTKGFQKRDFIYVEDVADAYLEVIENIDSIKENKEFDIATGTQVYLKDFIEQIYSTIKKYKNIKTYLDFGALPYRVGECMYVEENVKDIYDLGWRPKISLNHGIENIVLYELNSEKFN